MKKIILIPSAGMVPDELKTELGYIPTAMIPLKGKPVIEKIISSYNKFQDIKFFVTEREDSDKLENYMQKKNMNSNVIKISKADNLGESILISLNKINELVNPGKNFLIIHFGDTLIDTKQIQMDQDFITYSIVEDPFRWTGFETDENNRIINISEKFTSIGEENKKIFNGVFGIKDPREFIECLKNSSANGQISFYGALTDYLKSREYRLILTEEWTDLGHLDTYYDAKKKYMNCRKFNEITIDKKRNIICKKSHNKFDFINEIKWYKDLPKDIQYLIPRVFNSSTDIKEPFIELGYITYPTLTDIFLYGEHPLYVWNSIFNNIFSLIEDFRKHEIKSEKNNIRDSIKEMYRDKTIKRLEMIKNDEFFDILFSNEKIVINGKGNHSIRKVINSIDILLEKVSIYEIENLNIIHGDMCFNNIFYDVRNRIIKLVDPRGSFGNFKLYGDYRYELAKLRHSVYGNYDFIINDLFEIEKNKEIKYKIYREDKHKQIASLFLEKLKKKYRKEMIQIQVIESLLFLSMAALHNYDKKRQLLMLAIGIEKFNECMKKLGID